MVRINSIPMYYDTTLIETTMFFAFLMLCIFFKFDLILLLSDLYHHSNISYRAIHVRAHFDVP